MSARAYTLVELLITIVLIGLLAAIAGTRIGAARRAAYVAAMEADLQSLISAQEAYYARRLEAGKPRYAASLKSLNFVPSENVVIRLRARRNGWAARAEHKRLRPERYYCAVFVGKVKAFAPATDEGVIECEPKKHKRRKRRK